MVHIEAETGIAAQESPNFHVVVNMVQLNVAVTDKKGNYVTGLRPQDFAIVEDGIVEKTATFAEGDEPARRLSEFADGFVRSVRMTWPDPTLTVPGSDLRFGGKWSQCVRPV